MIITLAFMPYNVSVNFETEVSMSRFITTSNARIHVIDEGHGDIVFVFLHYWGGSARTWHHVVNGLRDKARCIRIDLRGWGRSVAQNECYDLETMAEDVSEVISALGLKRVVLVGHSMGGKIAQILASKQGLDPEALILVAPSPPTGMPVPRDIREQMLTSYQSPEGVAQALRILANKSLSSEDRAIVFEDTLAGADGAKREWTESGMVDALKADVSTIIAPVQILVGDEDKVERVEALRSIYSSILPEAHIEVLADTGHLSPLENPRAIIVACERELARLATAA